MPLLIKWMITSLICVEKTIDLMTSIQNDLQRQNIMRKKNINCIDEKNNRNKIPSFVKNITSANWDHFIQNWKIALKGISKLPYVYFCNFFSFDSTGSYAKCIIIFFKPFNLIVWLIWYESLHLSHETLAFA